MVAPSDDNLNVRRRLAMVDRVQSLEIVGQVRSLTGLTIEVIDFAAPVGAQCEIRTRSGATIAAEVIGFRSDAAVLMPLGDMVGIAAGDMVRCLAVQPTIAVGAHLLGRVINGRGEPIDGKGPLLCQTRSEIGAGRIQPLQRVRIDTPIGTGIRVIDAMLTCGGGQRMGIFSGPGVGKSVLLGMISRFTSADVTVIALVGERGREVREFIEKDLGPKGLEHSVVVVSTSDEPAPVRVHAGFVATSVAEFFRDQGKNVLLLMDSVTRIAMAQRQIGLALGEPPATKGYTPSVFALLPRLVERSGRTQKGSITGFYTVLVEGDDLTEPVSDAMRGLLDGHIWLSRDLSNRGHYPAVDLLESVSRVMPDVVDEQHQQAARAITRLVAVYRDIEDIVNIGAYAPGTSAEFDLAVKAHETINQFLQQRMDESVGLDEAVKELVALLERIQRGAAGQPVSTASPVSQEPERATTQGPPLGTERVMAGL